MTTGKRHVAKRVLLVLLISVAALLLLGIIALWWAGPALVQSQLRQALEEQWDGPVTVGQVRLNLRRPSVVEKITLTDNQGRTWMDAQHLALSLGSWRGGHPRLTHLRLEQLTLHPYDVSDRRSLPLRPSTGPRRRPVDISQFVDLGRLDIDALVLYGVTPEGAPPAPPNVQTLSFSRNQQAYDLVLAPAGPASAPPILWGSVAADGSQVDLHVRLNHRFTEIETALALRLTGQSEPAAIAGTLRADLGVRGSPRDPNTLEVEGTLDLSGWSVGFGLPGPLTEGQTRLVFHGRQIELMQTQGLLAGRQVRLAARGELRPQEVGVMLQEFSLALPAAGQTASALTGQVLLFRQSDGKLGYRGKLVGRPADMQIVSFFAPSEDVPVGGTVYFEADFKGANDALVVDVSGSADLGFTTDVLSRAVGRFQSTLNINGSGSPVLSARGTVMDWRGWGYKGQTLENLKAHVDYSERGLTVSELEVNTPEGPVTGEVSLEWGSRTRVRYTGRLSVAGLDASELLTSPAVTRCQLWVDAFFAGAAGDHLTISATGRAAATVEVAAARAVAATSPELKVIVTPIRPPSRKERREAAARVAAQARAAAASQGEPVIPPQPLEASGPLAAEITLSNPFSESRRSIRGQARLTGWEVTAGPALLKGLQLEAAFQGSRIEVTRLNAQTTGGGLTGLGHVEFAPGRPMEYGGEFNLTGLDHAAVIGLWSRPAWLQSVTLDLHAVFAGRGAERLHLACDGHVASEADLPIRSLASRWNCDLTLTRPPATPDDWRLEGEARIDGGPVVGAGDLITRSFGASMLFVGRGLDITNIRADCADGDVEGLCSMNFPTGRAPEYRGNLSASGIDVGKLAAALGRPQTTQRGFMHFDYRFRGDPNGSGNVIGSGRVMLRQSRLASLSVIQAILTVLTLGQSAAEEGDADAEFTHEGYLMTLQSAQVATAVVGIEALPPSTVNFSTRELDIYVVTGVLGKLKPLLSLPLLDLLVPFTQRLTRLHVVGQYDESSSLRISKEPLKDVGVGTFNFFKGVVGTGGKLGGAILSPFGQLAPS